MKSKLLLLLALLAGALRAETTWLTDFPAAQTQARADHKKILVDFTGSDWCVSCISLEKEVLGSPEFETFARDYVLVRIDYLRKKPQPAELKAQNSTLREKYQIEAFPTVLLLDAEGAQLASISGYSPGTKPARYLAQFTETAAK